MLLAIILVFIILSAGLARYMLGRDHGEKEPRGALWKAFGIGFLGLILAGGLELIFLSGTDLPGQPLDTLIWMSLAVGLIEELSKCVPLIFLLYRKRYFNEHTDGVIYFALAGMGFGLPENILYTLQFGAGAGLVRLILTPIFHAATTGLIGYMLVKVKLDHAPKYTVAVTIALVALAHGLYDFGLYSHIGWFVVLSLVITVALSINLFILYHKATVLDQLRGLSAVGDNSVCRTCGFANPNHNLYCSQCGNHA